MALEHAQLERLLCERFCPNVRIHRRDDDVLMLESPFTFPDGDHYPIYLSETADGGLKLSDRGYTLMHVSYDHDVDSLYEGPRASLREQIVREGVFSMETPPDQVATALFSFGQALTKIHGLTLLSCERLPSTFYEDQGGLLFTILNEENVDTDYISPDVPNADNYPVDYHFVGRDGRPVFLYRVSGRDKARPTIIMLSHLLLHGLTCECVIAFADQQEIPRLNLARLTNIAGAAVASLDAQEAFRRKTKRHAA